jgi:tRNA nucleotidyltransferase/poly(A) polymerase
MRFFEIGGCVRDKLLGVKSKDIDYSAVLEPNEKTHCQVTGQDPFDFMLATLIGRQFDIFELRPEFLTIRARFPKGSVHSGLTADFVLARKEADYTDGRRPDKVEPGTLEDDIFRRDFTMNALAEDEEGNLIDLVGGVQDINDKIIRAVGDPFDRFEEDALRIMRALRFKVTKGFTIDPVTQSAMVSLMPNLAGVSAERVREELVRMFNADPMWTVFTLDSFGVFPIIFDMGINLQPTLKEKIK